MISPVCWTLGGKSSAPHPRQLTRHGRANRLTQTQQIHPGTANLVDFLGEPYTEGPAKAPKEISTNTPEFKRFETAFHKDMKRIKGDVL